MAYINVTRIREELVVFLRNQNIFSISQRGVTTATETFDGDNSEVDFVVANASNIKNVRSVEVGGTPLVFGTDYTVNYTTGTVTCSVAPASGTDNVEIVYDYGTDKIYPDFPRNDLSISSFPRIGVDLIGVDSEPGGFGNVNVSNIDFTVVVYEPKTEQLTGYIDSIREAFISERDNFYYIRQPFPLRHGPIIKNPTDKTKDKIFQQNIDFRSFHNYEIN